MSSHSDQQPESSSEGHVQATCLSCGHAALMGVGDLPASCPECNGTLDIGEETVRKPEQRPRDTLLGETIGGRYQLERRIGTGGFGRVYEAIGVAEDSQAELQYAVKVLHDRYCDEPRSVDEFFSEVKKASLLAHPAVVTVIDSGWHGGVPYIVMEYIRGCPLKEVLKELDGRLDVATSLRIVSQVADVVASAHDTGLIHRDIKPANIMVIGECDPTTTQVKVLDFGIAKLETEMSQNRVTIAGTAGYQAPEQAEGHPTQGSDVWALGVVLYQLLNGRLPNKAPEGWSSERKREYLAKGEPFPFEQLGAPGDIQAEVEDVVKRLLSYEADDRPSARETYIRLDTLRVKALMATSRDEPTRSRFAPMSDPRAPAQTAPQPKPAAPPPEPTPPVAERAEPQPERVEPPAPSPEPQAESPASGPVQAEPQPVPAPPQPTASATTQTEHRQGVHEAARRRAAQRTSRPRRRPRRTFGRTLGRLFVAVVAIAILCAIATGLGLVYFREDAVLGRMARAAGSEQRLKEDRRYQSWLKWHDLALARFGPETDRVRVRVGLLFYEGRADEAYEDLAKHRREDLRPWLFGLVKSRVQGRESLKAKTKLVLDVQRALTAQERGELEAALEAAALETLQRRGEAESRKDQAIRDQLGLPTNEREAPERTRTVSPPSRSDATGKGSGQRRPSKLPDSIDR